MRDALKEASPAAQPEPVAWHDLTELEKDAANLLFALHDAWPYVHQWCTIETRKKRIQSLMVKHGDFADLHPPAAQPAPAQEPVALEEYDAGILSDYGGGNVEWWQDYIRAELGRAYEHYQSQITIPPAQPARVEA